MIRVQDLELRSGSFHLSGLRFEVPAGRYAVLMGRTGSGKTSLLEALCGLRAPAAGRVWVAGREVGHLRPAERGIGYVPQDGALFPHLDVREHLGFAARVRGAPSREVEEEVSRWADRLGLEPLLQRRPRELSGGERQKVALGRALARRPGVLLLDEPLAALDEESWARSLELLSQVHRETGVTVLHVTHRSAEAEAVAQTRLRLRDGVVEEEA